VSNLARERPRGAKLGEEAIAVTVGITITIEIEITTGTRIIIGMTSK
jgi:hypothetical protein